MHLSALRARGGDSLMQPIQESVAEIKDKVLSLGLKDTSVLKSPKKKPYGNFFEAVFPKVEG